MDYYYWNCNSITIQTLIIAIVATGTLNVKATCWNKLITTF